jgi:hypothetical protein
MNGSPPDSQRIALRLTLAVIALAVGIVAAVVAIELVRTVLSMSMA